jgi:hypothetical protein
VVTLIDPRLRIDQVPNEPGWRRLIVTYQLDMTEVDVALDPDVFEQAIVRSRDLHDSPTPPKPTEIRLEHRGRIDRPGIIDRELTGKVKRTDLDVQQDWWRTDHGGGVEAIAEMPDHLVAEITLSIDGQVMAEATTAVVTGSWGALGSD